MTEWKKERCSERPLELQTIAPGLCMERRNIVEVEHDGSDGLEAYTDYECECREITKSEYNMLKSVEAINVAAAIDQYTMQLIEEGVL